MAAQPALFPGAPDAIPVTHAVAPVERRRLRRQCYTLLARLRLGPATNYELAAIACNYTARLSELRAEGFTIDLEARNRVTGHVTYRLVAEP